MFWVECQDSIQYKDKSGQMGGRQGDWRMDMSRYMGSGYLNGRGGTPRLRAVGFEGNKSLPASNKPKPAANSSRLLGWGKFFKKTLGLGLLGSLVGYGVYQDRVHGLLRQPQVMSVAPQPGENGPLVMRIQKEVYPTVPGVGLYNPVMSRVQLEFVMKVSPIKGSWSESERKGVEAALQERGSALYGELLDGSVQPLMETYLASQPMLKTPRQGAIQILLEEDFLLGRSARVTLQEIPCRLTLTEIQSTVRPSPFALPNFP